MMKLRGNEEAVSPVIGVILMVAITVILAAVIAAFVFGMSDSVKPQKEITLTAAQSATAEGAPVVVVKLFGGSDVGLLDDNPFTVKINGVTKPGAELTNKTGSSGSYELNSGRNTVLVVAHFADGTEQIVLDKIITVAKEAEA